MRLLRTASLVLAAPLLFTACSSTSTTTPADPMSAAVSQLSSEDNTAGQSHPDADYVAALQDLTKQCTQTKPTDIANMADAVWDGLKKAGITDEDRLSLLQHFSASIPAGSQPMDCVQVFAAYETLREG